MGLVLVQEFFLNIVLPIHTALIIISINLQITENVMKRKLSPPDVDLDSEKHHNLFEH